MSEIRNQRSEISRRRLKAVPGHGGQRSAIEYACTDLRLPTPDFWYFTLRYLARHSHKATTAALYVLLSLLILFPTFSAANEETEAEYKKKQIEQIEIDLNREKEKYLKFDVKEKDILEQLSLIENEIAEKRKIIDEIEGRIDSRKKELETHRKKLAELESDLNHAENLLAKRLVAFYKNAKRGYIKVLLSTEDLDILNHNMKYLRVIMDCDRDAMRELARTSSEYHSQMSVIEEQINAVAHLEESENNNLGDLKQALQKEVLMLARIHSEKESYEVSVRELQSAADFLKNTISNLEKSPKKSKGPLPTGFADSKGRLPPPVNGKVLKNVKKKGVRSIEKLKGIFFEGPYGAEVKAVYAGRVDYSGVLKGYGQVIVINHGERYFTISAYLSGRKKSEGETVSPGETIGYVGEAGLSTGPALYFEIRRGEENLNPLKWLKVN